MPPLFSKNLDYMNDTFLYTLPQWFIFAGVFVVAYGWIEDKKPFRLMGAAIFIALGLYALFVIMGDYFAAGNYLTPEEIATEELEEDIMPQIPFQAQLFPAYLTFLISSVLAIPALLFEIKNSRRYRLFIALSILISLLGFFIIVGKINAV